MADNVLIVGAGPTGLMLANQLARRGIRFEIIDRHSGPAQQTRAMAVHARTLEIYSRMGLSDRALELGQRGDGANVWANGKWRARIPLRDMGESLSPFPFVLMLGQDDNERIMGEKLREQGFDVQWNTELVSFKQGADGVSATLKQPDGSTRTVSAAYIAGCDGGRSTVREISGIQFPGAPYEHTFFVADTEATGAMVQNELNVYLWKDGFHLFFPMRGRDRWRVIGILPRNLRERRDVTFEELLPFIAQEAGANLAFKSCSWFSTYRIFHRCVEHFRDRRAFLAGDAAHVHSPMGGQGMNTGLQDAYNLAWKLGMVLSGRADQKLLDTYEAERKPVAHGLLESTDRAFTLVVSDSWIAGLFRTRIASRIAATVMKFSKARAAAFRTVSQIGISYPESALSQSSSPPPAGAPQSGDRFPWLHLRFADGQGSEDVFERFGDMQFNLLVVGQDASASISELPGILKIHTVRVDGENAKELAKVAIRAPVCYLLRPDGHIGFVSQTPDAAAIGRYFSSVGIRA